MAKSVRSVSRNTSVSVPARRRRALLQRFLPLLVLSLGVLGAPFLLVSSGGIGRLDELQEEKKAVQLEIFRLTRRIEHLKARASALKSDPEAVERAARDQLGLVRRTEVVFQFKESSASAPRNAAASR